MSEILDVVSREFSGEGGRKEEVTLFLLPVDVDGKPLPAEQVDINGLEILLE